MSESETYDLKTKLGGLAGASFLRVWMGTLDFKIAHYDCTSDPARPDFGGHCIHVFWHEYLTFPGTIWGHCDMAALVSQHRDGDWASRAARHLGFDIVRGSTTRGGAAALRELKRKSQHCNLTIMPDGPKGPRRKMSNGPVYLASRLQIPIVPVGFGYQRPWRLNSWDRFALPRPFSRARSIFGPRIMVPKRLDRNGLEETRGRIEILLNDLTEQAELWAASGQRIEGQVALVRHANRRRLQQRPQQFTDLADQANPGVHRNPARRAA